MMVVPVGGRIISAPWPCRARPPGAVRVHAFIGEVHRVGHHEHVDVVARILALEAGLGVHAVLGAERQVDAAHALVGADVVDAALAREGAVHAEAQFAHPHFAFVAADDVEHFLEFRRAFSVSDHAAALDDQGHRRLGTVRPGRRCRRTRGPGRVR
jgi:hypothetical protein